MNDAPVHPVLAPLEILVNGDQHSLDARYANVAARPAARAPPPDRHEEGLRPRPVRRLHRPPRRPPRQRVPPAGGRARRCRGGHGRGPRRRGRRPASRCRRPSSSTTRSSAATARPGQICSAIGMAGRGRGRLAEPRDRRRRRAAVARRGRDPRADEREHLPLRRVSEHRQRDRGRVRLKPFRYERAAGPDGAVALLARTPGAKFLGGGTNLVDLLRLGVETPSLLIDVVHAGDDRVEPSGDGGLRIGAAVRNSDLAADPLRPLVLPGDRPGGARRRVGPAPQPRDDRRQPAAADALRLLPGCDQPVQQARARHRLPGPRGRAPEPRRARPLRAVRRHPSLRHRGRARRLRRDRARARPRRRARDPARRPPPASRRPPAAGHGARARRPDRRRRAAAAAGRRPLVLPQGARACILLVRARLGRGGHRRVDGDAIARRADRLRRPRAQAVARVRGRGRAARRPAGDEAFGQAADRELQQAQPLRDNGYKLQLARNLLVRTLSELAA